MTRLSEPVRPSVPQMPMAMRPPSISNGPPDFVPADRGVLVERTAPPVPTSVIAARLKWFRTERGLRLEDVAKRAGYTKGFLSKIEHGKASPPVATLLRVAAALGVEADVLFAPDAGVAPDATVHTVAGHGVPVRDDTSGPGRALLALAANRHHKLMEPCVVTLEPRATGAEVPTTAADRRLTYPGEEFVYVLEGRVEYAVGEETYVLGPGDGLYFNATRPHSATAVGGTAKVVRVFCASPARRQRTGDVGE